MKRIVALSRTARMRRFGKFVERRARRAFEAFLDIVLPLSENGHLASDDVVRKILFVRPNFRIGNTVIATAFLPILRARFPDARIDYLAGDSTACLLEGLPIAHVHCVSRGFLLAPWRFLTLFVRLRRERFDLAVDGGMGSYSGALYAFLSGARQRLGLTGRGDRFLTIRVVSPPLTNVYEGAPVFARALGVACHPRPSYVVFAAEEAAAVATLRAADAGGPAVVGRFVAVFVGGHLGKQWPQAEWSALVAQLERDGVCVVVFVGPEEMAFADVLRAGDAAPVRLILPQPLRTFAALLAQATLLVTPDSGPLHLAAALGVPTIALLQKRASRYYAPQDPEDRALFRPNSAEVVAALRAHPRWPLVRPPVAGTAVREPGASDAPPAASVKAEEPELRTVNREP